MRQICAKSLVIFFALALFPHICDAEDTHISRFIGPYAIAFNDSHSNTDEPDDSIRADSCMGDITIRDEEAPYSFAVFFWTNAEGNLNIVIEEDLGGAEKELLGQDKASFVLATGEDFANIEERQRRIAGHEGVMKIAQSDEGHTMSVGTFWLRSKTSCDDTTIGKLALVQISCLDYTEEEFDRILDTFEIERYMKPIKEGSDL